MTTQDGQKRFFIAALPRSRTAWLSQLFSTGEVSCLHDGLNTYPNRVRLSQAMSGGKAFYGNADTGLMYTKFQEWFDAPTVIIRRDPREVIDSLFRVFGEHPGLVPLVLDMDEQLDRVEGLVIPFEEINDRLPEIWSHCVDTDYDSLRGENMKKMKIETLDIYGDLNSYREVMSCRG